MKALFKYLLVLLCIQGSIKAYSYTGDIKHLPSYTEVSQYNYLLLEGLVLNADKADIRIFVYVDTLSEWEEVRYMKKKSAYKVKLNPTLNYQVWFTTPVGGIKRLYISNGNKGSFFVQLDVDFRDPTPYVRLEQDSRDRYKVRSLSKVPFDPKHQLKSKE